MLATTQESTTFYFSPTPQRKQKKMKVIHTNSIQMAYRLLIAAAWQGRSCCSSAFSGRGSTEAKHIIPTWCKQQQQPHPALPYSWGDKKVYFCSITCLLQRQAHANEPYKKSWDLMVPLQLASTCWLLQQPASRPSGPCLSYGCFNTCLPSILSIQSLIIALLQIC